MPNKEEFFKFIKYYIQKYHKNELIYKRMMKSEPSESFNSQFEETPLSNELLEKLYKKSIIKSKSEIMDNYNIFISSLIKLNFKIKNMSDDMLIKSLGIRDIINYVKTGKLSSLKDIHILEGFENLFYYKVNFIGTSYRVFIAIKDNNILIIDVRIRDSHTYVDLIALLYELLNNTENIISTKYFISRNGDIALNRALKDYELNRKYKNNGIIIKKTDLKDNELYSLFLYYREQYKYYKNNLLNTDKNKYYYDLFVNSNPEFCKRFLRLFLQTNLILIKNRFHPSLLKVGKLWFYESHFSILSPEVKIETSTIKDINKMILSGLSPLEIDVSGTQKFKNKNINVLYSMRTFEYKNVLMFLSNDYSFRLGNYKNNDDIGIIFLMTELMVKMNSEPNLKY